MSFFNMTQYASILVLIFSLFLVADPAAARVGTANTATLKVRVISNNVPVIGALVTLRGADGDRRTEGYTNEAGECEFTELPSGIYIWDVSKKAFFKDADAGSQLNGITLSRNQSDTLVVSLVKGGVITGKLLDADGSVLWGVTVTAIKLDAGARNQSLPSKVESNVTSLTDDRGVFRIYGLRPGAYGIVINARRGHSVRKTISPTFYPSQAAWRDGVTIAVDLSAEAVLPDIQLGSDSNETGSIAGTVLDKNRSPMAEVPVFLQNSDGELISDEMPTTADGRFRFERLLPGKYKIRVKSRNNSYMIAERQIILNSPSLKELSIELDEYPVVEGTVKLWHTDKVSPLPNLEVNLISVQNGNKVSFSSDVNGEFAERVREEGSFIVDLPTLDKGCYLAQVTYNGKDVTNKPVQLSKNRSIKDVEILVATGAASIQGRVSGLLSGGCNKLLVFAVPAEGLQQNSYLRIRRADVCTGDEFIISALAPGKYFLVALLQRRLEDAKASDGKMEGVERHYSRLIKEAAGGLKLRSDDIILVNKNQRYAGCIPVFLPAQK